jgi:membrane protease YdiL (CAAX protease family)
VGALGLGRIEAGQHIDARAPSEYPYRRRLIAWCVFVSLLTAVNWAGRISEGAPDPNAAYDWNVSIGAVLQFALFLVIIAFIARGAWDLLALRRPVAWGRAVGAGLVLLVVVDVVNLALDPLLHPGREQGLTPSKWEPQHAGAFLMFAFAVVVLAPVTEELAFRGLGFSLLRPFGLVPPILGTAMIWALAHGLLEALPVITVLGIGLAWIRYKQDSTIPGMFVHATFNGLALAASLFL